MTDEDLVVLKQSAVAGVGIEDKLSVAKAIEHLTAPIPSCNGS